MSKVAEEAIDEAVDNSAPCHSNGSGDAMYPASTVSI